MRDVLKAAQGSEISLRAEREAELTRLEDEIFQEHYDIVKAVAMFKDVDPDSPNMTEEFAGRFQDKTAAKKAYRLAMSGWLPQKDAPSGVHFAYKVALGVMKVRAEARANQQTAPRLNIAVVINNSGGASDVYPEVIVKQADE